MPMATPSVDETPSGRRNRKRRERFTRDYIEQNSIPVPDAGCWIWLRRCDPCGYGKAFLGKRAVGAHRASFMAFNGPIDGATHVLHKCDTPACVNPQHLFAGNHLANIQDKCRKGRASRLIGERHPNAKLTTADAAEIYRSKESAAVLQRRYGVTRGVIWRIRAGKQWNHATGAVL